jgi:hypothetical protein
VGSTTAFHKFSNFLSSEVQKLAWEEERYMRTNQWYWVVKRLSRWANLKADCGCVGKWPADFFTTVNLPLFSPAKPHLSTHDFFSHSRL